MVRGPETKVVVFPGHKLIVTVTIQRWRVFFDGDSDEKFTENTLSRRQSLSLVFPSVSPLFSRFCHSQSPPFLLPSLSISPFSFLYLSPPPVLDLTVCACVVLSSIYSICDGVEDKFWCVMEEYVHLWVLSVTSSEEERKTKIGMCIFYCCVDPYCLGVSLLVVGPVTMCIFYCVYVYVIC